LSYGIILYKSHGKPSFDKEYLGRVLQDENTQYFFLAIVWATAPPIRGMKVLTLVALFPYAVFSLFHTLGYIRSELIPKTFPGSTFPQAKAVASAINSLMLKFQPKSIWAVSRVEVWVIFPMTVISIFWGGTSIFTPVLYQQFLQFRFLSSPMTREVFSETEVFLDKHILNNQKVPEWGRNGYSSAKEMIQKYCNLEARARAAQAAQ
jgi:hypothetical protein